MMLYRWFLVTWCLGLACSPSLISGQSGTPTPTAPQPQLAPLLMANGARYDGSVTITVTNTYALRNCRTPIDAMFECTQCPAAASNIQLAINLAQNTSCTAVSNWWTPQYGLYNLTSLGYTYVPNPNYTSFNSLGYYGGFFRLYKIPYQPDNKPSALYGLAWHPETNTNVPPPTACNSNTLIREFEIMPLSKCPSSNWSALTANTPLAGVVTAPVTPIFDASGVWAPPAPGTQVANQFPDTMSWFRDPTFGDQVTLGTGHGSTCGSPSTTDSMLHPIVRSWDYLGTPWCTNPSPNGPCVSQATCFISDCTRNYINISTEYPQDTHNFGFQATFDVTGFPYTSCPPALQASAPTQSQVTTPCNDTHASLIQQQCGGFNTTVVPSPTGNLSFLTPLFSPIRTSLSSLSITTNATYNYTVSSSYCNITATWRSCLVNINNQTVPWICKQAVFNETSIVLGNTAALPNCSNLTTPPSPVCGAGTRLDPLANVCNNITTCTLKCNTTSTATTRNTASTSRIFYWDSDILANGSYCGQLYPTYSYLGCTLPSTPLTNVTYIYTWNDSMVCNTTSISWSNNVTIVIGNTTCLNGSWYNTIITSNITGMNTTYPNGTIIISNITTIIISNTTTNTNISCQLPTSLPTIYIPPSTEVTLAPTTAPTSNVQDKAAGTAMALILGFSSLGVGILYWVWFRARKAKPNWQQTQSRQHQQHHDDDEDDDEHI